MFKWLRTRWTKVDTGIIGQRLEVIEASEFFLWFHMRRGEPDPQRSPVEHQLVAYRPEGEAFREDVCLLVQHDGGVITAVQLGLSGAMYSPDIRPYAYDIAKSFLDAVAPRGPEHPAFASLYETLQTMMARGVGHELSDPPLHEAAREAVHVFMGIGSRAELAVPGLRLYVFTPQPGEPWSDRCPLALHLERDS